MSIKRIVIAASLGLGVVVFVAALAWLLVDDATLVSALGRQLQSVSGTRITYQGDTRVTRTLTPRLSVEQLIIEDRNARYRVETSSLQIQISLPRLLLGQLDIPLLWLGDTRVTLMQGASSAASAADSGKTMQQGFEQLPFKPVLHDLQIGKVSFLQDGEELQLPAIDVDEITLKLEPKSDTLALTAQIELAGEPFAIEVALPALDNAIRSRTLGFSASAQSSGFKLGADGQIAFDQASPIINAVLNARAIELSKVPTGIDALVIPGTLTANAQLEGTFDQLVLSNLSANWKGDSESELNLNGGIENVLQLDGIQLRLAGKLAKPAWLAPLFPDGMDPLDSADLNTGISGAYQQLSMRDFSLHAKTADELDLLLSGQFDIVPGSAGMQPENIDLKLAFSAPTTQAARGLLFDQIPEFGAITGKADIRGGGNAATLKNILIKTKDSEGSEVDLSGGIAQFPFDADKPNSGYDLDVVMKATSTSITAKRLGVDLPLSGPMKLTYRIEGDTQALALKQINLSAGEKKAIRINAKGQLLFGNWDLADPLQSVDLMFEANSPDTASFTSLIGQQFPELGALSANARLHTVSGKHQIDKLRIRTRSGAPVKATLTGAVNDVILFPQAALQGIQLKASATAADSAQLNSLFTLEHRIPAIGPLQASANITGSQQQLLIKDVSVTAGQPEGLLVTAKGSLGNLSAANEWHPHKADLRIKAESPSSRELLKSLGYQIPELGPITAQAKMLDKKKTMRVESALIKVGDADTPVMQATGFVDDLFGAGKTRWDVTLNMDGQALAAFAEKKKLSDLEGLVGSMVIDNSDGTLGMESLEIKTTHAELQKAETPSLDTNLIAQDIPGPVVRRIVISKGDDSLGMDSLQVHSTQADLLSLAVKGRFDDFQKPETLSLDVNLTARDLKLIGAWFDHEWPAIGPVQLKSEIKQAGNATAFDTRLNAGDMQLNAQISGDFTSTPPQLSGSITAKQFFLPDFLGEVIEDVEQDIQAEQPIFSKTPIDHAWLKKVDLDLSVDIASFNKEKSQLKSAQFVVKQKSGNLLIDPATLVYPQGKVDLDLQIDSQDPPRMTFKALGKDLDPWQTLGMQKGQEDFATNMDVDIALTTSGSSQHELAANTNGEVYILMKNGKMRRTLLNLMLVDIIGWTFSKTSREPFVDIDCGVADYVIHEGVITTKAFLLDNRDLAISGKGTIDLGNEQIDYVMLPKKKSRTIKHAGPVKITGALSNPKITAIPWTSAATTYGGLVFFPQIFIGLSIFDRLKGATKTKQTSSPCLEYERWDKSHNEAPVEK